jgi:predicted nucleic acid-binding protein
VSDLEILAYADYRVQALSRNLILVTNNEKEFQRIASLQTKNWAA